VRDRTKRFVSANAILGSGDGHLKDDGTHLRRPVNMLLLALCSVATAYLRAKREQVRSLAYWWGKVRKGGTRLRRASFRVVLASEKIMWTSRRNALEEIGKRCEARLAPAFVIECSSADDCSRGKRFRPSPRSRWYVQCCRYSCNHDVIVEGEMCRLVFFLKLAPVISTL
jgi:hypothetical protein